MQSWQLAGQEAITEVKMRKHPFPLFGSNIAVLFHIHGGNEALNKMQDWILLYTNGILQFEENLTFTEKKEEPCPWI